MQNIRMQLGQRVRQLRKDAGWSQEQLGERADLHSTYIGGIERGERNVSLDNLQNIANAFGVSVAELFEFSRSRHPKQGGRNQRLHVALRRLSADEREFVAEYVEMLERWLKS